jgi:hypothetical protein
MKKLFIIFAVVVCGLIVQEVALARAVGFYEQCLSSGEAALVRSREARNLLESDLTEFVDEKLSCIESKQTAFERIVVRVMGKFFYYPILL